MSYGSRQSDLRAAESENYEKYSSFTYNTYYLAASKFQAEDEDDSDKAVKAAEEAAREAARQAAHRRLVIRLTCVGAFSALVIALAVVLIRKLHKAGRC